MKIGQVYIEETSNLGMFIVEIVGFKGNQVVIRYIYSQIGRPGTEFPVDEKKVSGVLSKNVKNKGRIIRKIFTARTDWKI